MVPKSGGPVGDKSTLEMGEEEDSVSTILNY